MAAPTTKKILLVDDEDDVRDTLCDQLTSSLQNIRVIQATNGSEALAKINNERFDLLITDMKMPKIDGLHLLGLLKKISSLQRPKSVLIISGHIDPEVPPIEISGLVYMAKPVVIDDFVDKVKDLLEDAGGSADAAKKSVAQASGKTNKIDATLINTFADATLAVLGTTAQVAAQKLSARVKPQNEGTLGDISAVIAMNSGKQLGSLAITFEKGCFLSVVSGMLGSQSTEITAENQDAAGEICNQIFGAARKQLNERGYTIQPAIPKVNVGANHVIQHFATGPRIEIVFSTPTGKFSVEAVLQTIG